MSIKPSGTAVSVHCTNSYTSSIKSYSKHRTTWFENLQSFNLKIFDTKFHNCRCSNEQYHYITINLLFLSYKSWQKRTFTRFKFFMVHFMTFSANFLFMDHFHKLITPLLLFQANTAQNTKRLVIVMKKKNFHSL